MSLLLNPSRFLVALLAVLSLTAGPAAAAGEAHHDHGGGARLTLDQGRKWPTDAPLRQAMGRIRQSVAGALEAIHQDRLAPGGYAALASTVNDQVAYMVSHCKLEPKADAQLHLVIAELLAGAEAMAGQGAAPQRREGAVRVVAALGSYGDHFDDAGWQPLAH